MIRFVESTLTMKQSRNMGYWDYTEDEFGTVLTGEFFTERGSIERAQPLQGSVPNAYRFNFEITDSMVNADIHAIITISDVSLQISRVFSC